MRPLRERIEAATSDDSDAAASVRELLIGLECGEIRAAVRDGDAWRAEPWVKRGILLAFGVGRLEDFASHGPLEFRDKHNLAPRRIGDLPPSARVVPGGSAVRAGAHVGDGAVLMPPCYVNVGAFVGAGSLVDSHALVGSCAQVGERVHLSAAAQLGGVLEPAGSLPVIVEDDALIGGGAGIYEGVLVRERAVIGAGVVLTRSTPIYDLVHGRSYGAGADGVLEVPPGAVVVPGSRPASGTFAEQHGLQIASPLIVKYRDSNTDARVALEEALR